MTARRPNGGFASRPRDAETWINAPDRAANASPASDPYTARLTVDITPALRGRIKIAALPARRDRRRHAADAARAREFPDTDGGNS
jgi:hypothetical protein